jgi:N,N'-diacetyllegionaminate synthase
MEIVAEAAIAHDGVLDRALLLVRAAGAAKPDAVKFQVIVADELATPDYRHYETFRRCEFEPEAWRRLVKAAHEEGLRFYSDVFGETSLELARQAEVDGVKIHSSSITNLRLITAASRTFERVHLHCGGAEAREIEAAVAARAAARCVFTLLVGFQAEPTPLEENHLRRIPTLKARFPHCQVGFMDHTDAGHPLRGRLALVALGLGAGCVEKHLTLHRSLKLEDHVTALDPGEFHEFCAEIRAAELALGSEQIDLTQAERRYAAAYRQRVVALTDLPPGTRLSYEHLATKRIGGMEGRADLFDRPDAVVGRVLRSMIKRDRPVSSGDLVSEPHAAP